MTIDPKVLDELEWLEKAATPGPWKDGKGVDGKNITMQVRWQVPIYGIDLNEEWCSNLELIDGLRTHASVLLAAAREAERMRAVCEAAAEYRIAEANARGCDSENPCHYDCWEVAREQGSVLDVALAALKEKP